MAVNLGSTVKEIIDEINKKSEGTTGGSVNDVMVKTDSSGDYSSVLGGADSENPTETPNSDTAYIDLSVAGKIKDVTLNGTSKVDSNGIVKLDGIYTNFTSVAPQHYTINGITRNAVRFDRNSPTFEVFNSFGEAVFTQIRYSEEYIYYCFEMDDTDQYTFRAVGGNSIAESNETRYYQHTMFFTVGTPITADIGSTYGDYTIQSCTAVINGAKVVRVTDYADAIIKQAITPINGTYDLSFSTSGFVDITYTAVGTSSSDTISGTVSCPIKYINNINGSKYRVDYVVYDIVFNDNGCYHMTSRLEHLEFTPEDITNYIDNVTAL